MAIFTSNLILDKCGMGGFYQKQNDGTLAAQENAGVVMNGAFVPAMAILGFTGQAFAYRYFPLETMLAGSTYDISGKATPVGAQVFLSFADGNRSEDLLFAMSEKSPAASTTSGNEDGSFSFTNVLHEGGLCIVWIKCPPDFANVSTMDLSAQATRLNTFEGAPLTTLVDLTGSYPCTQCNGTGAYGCATHGNSSFQHCDSCGGTGYISDEVCPKCGGYGYYCYACVDEGGTGICNTGQCPTCGGAGKIYYKNWSGTISGQCPADAGTVYLSSGYSDNCNLESLESNVISSVVSVANDDGSFSYNFSIDTSAQAYTIWCLSITGSPLTANASGTHYNSESGDSSNPCLSGDTLITMADGHGKRLDELKAGDMILSGDGGETMVTKTGRGVWQPFHTLYYFADGTVIDEIADHRFFNVEQGFWQKLNRWNIGEHAKRCDGEEIALVKVERVDEEAECFGLWTESHDHFANGLLGGEAAANRPFLEDATLEQAMDMAISLSEVEVEKMFYGGVL